jgi:hypothetical protein
MTDPRAVPRADRSASLAPARGRVILLRRASHLTVLLLPANVSFVHTKHMRKRDAVRFGHTASRADP